MSLRFTLIAVSLFLILPFAAWSQNYDRINQIKKRLAATSDGVDQFVLLGDLAFEYRFAHPDSTIYYSNKAKALGEKLKLGLGLARPYNFIGVAYNYKGDRLAAYDAYTKALEIGIEQLFP